MKIAFLSVVGMTVLIILISLLVIHSLLNPARKEIDEFPEHDYQEVSFSPRDGELDLKGWLIPAGKNSSRTIIFAHGYGNNRTENISVANHLVKKGFNVLLFDFRNSGQSASDLTTIGQKEVFDLLGAVDFIQQKREQQNIGVIGFSMGAATALQAAKREPAIKALVVDSAFSDLNSYLKKSLTVWTKLPAFPFNFFILRLGRLLYGLEPKKVNPLQCSVEIERPVFFIHGREDKLIGPENSRQMYKESSGSEDKLWEIPGVGHVEAAEEKSDEYNQKVNEFFLEHLN
ncbi:MAG: alpha/beta hydrolase [Halanaerobiaceae bacterium]